MPEPTTPITVALDREQAKAVYELTIAKAVALEAAEDAAHRDFGSRRYRDAADSLLAAMFGGVS